MDFLQKNRLLMPEDECQQFWPVPSRTASSRVSGAAILFGVAGPHPAHPFDELLALSVKTETAGRLVTGRKLAIDFGRANVWPAATSTFQLYAKRRSTV